MIKSRRMRWAGHVTRMKRRGMYIGYWWESQKERVHWEDQDVCRWTKVDIREREWDGMDWIGLTQDRDQWRALVNMIINLGVP
jgi:hypothetical protein